MSTREPKLILHLRFDYATLHTLITRRIIHSYTPREIWMAIQDQIERVLDKGVTQSYTLRYQQHFFDDEDGTESVEEATLDERRFTEIIEDTRAASGRYFHFVVDIKYYGPSLELQMAPCRPIMITPANIHYDNGL